MPMNANMMDPMMAAQMYQPMGQIGMEPGFGFPVPNQFYPQQMQMPYGQQFYPDQNLYGGQPNYY